MCKEKCPNDMELDENLQQCFCQQGYKRTEMETCVPYNENELKSRRIIKSRKEDVSSITTLISIVGAAVVFTALFAVLIVLFVLIVRLDKDKDD